MRRNYPYLKDAKFLNKIDCAHYVEQYVKITALDWDEQPIEDIEGLVTGGTLSINGESALRRTVNFTASFKNDTLMQITNINNIFSINKKIYLEIGYLNKTNQYTEYPIIWFPQGVFILMNCSISHDAGGVNISAQLHDKMCLLNGTCGGTIPASTRLDTYDTVDENGNYIINKPTISQIITELVNHFGNEQLGKIIVSDIDNRIKMVMKWIGNSPIYLYTDDGNYFMTTNYDIAQQHSYTPYSYNDNVGYIYTDFTYTEELIANAGENICSVLDKIKAFLGGNYEYFYDIYGNFVFQEIKNYLNTSHTTVVLDELNNNSYTLDIGNGKRAYTFDDKPIIVSYSNSPQYNNIKNDYVVWGLRKNSDGVNIPIRFHLAIDTKPDTGNMYEVFFYTDPEDGIEKAKMPIDYNSLSAFPNQGYEGVFYRDISTGYIYIWKNNEYVRLTDVTMTRIQTNDWRSELYLQGVAAEPLGIESNYYYMELANEWPLLYDLKAESHTDAQGTYYTGAFRPEVEQDLSSINYFLDFIDSTAAISQFNVNAIGRRSQIENNDNFNCVFEPSIPDFVIIETGTSHTQADREECEARGQAYIQVDSNIYSTLASGGGLNSCFVEVKNLLYNYTGYNESIQMQTLPIYHLEPNIRIGAKDMASDIYGDYMLKSLSIPLRAGDNMSVSALRVSEKL